MGQSARCKRFKIVARKKGNVGIKTVIANGRGEKKTMTKQMKAAGHTILRTERIRSDNSLVPRSPSTFRLKPSTFRTFNV